MKTVITIEFDSEVPSDRVDELVAAITAQCDEDEEGYSWTEGSYQLTTKLVHE